MKAHLPLLLSAVVALSLGSEPQLVIQPNSILKANGENVFARCKALVDDASLVTEMFWYNHEGSNVNDLNDPRITVDSSKPGVLGLYLKQLEEKDIGQYRCEAVYSNRNLEATIDINAFKSIDFGETPTQQTALLGEDYEVRCDVTAMPAPEISWQKDGVYLAGSDRLIVQQNSLLLKGISVEDEGVYTCRATQIEQSDMQELQISLEVVEKPVLTIAPQDETGKEKESVTFTCEASGKPDPEYSWVNPQNEPVENSDHYTVDPTSGTLNIFDLQPSHAGIYRCTATNKAGSVDAEAGLQVHTKPRLEMFENITTTVNDTAHLVCKYSGSPSPVVAFAKEGQDLFVDGVNTDDRIEVTQETDDQGHIVATLTIRDVMRGDDGLYSCRGESEGGVTERWGHITVQFRPNFEDQPTTEFWTELNLSVNLTCQANSIPNATVQWYLRNEEIPKGVDQFLEINHGPVAVLQVTPLDASYFGTYTCEATNVVGYATQDITLSQVTKPGTIQSANADLITATTITWGIVGPHDDGGRDISQFIVQFAPNDVPIDEGRHESFVPGQTYTLDSLTPNTEYIFRFMAKNEIGESEWSSNLAVTTRDFGPPEKPEIFDRTSNVSAYKDRVDIQWRAPIDNGKPVDHYKITYQQVVFDTLDRKGVLAERMTKDTHFSMNGLTHDSMYVVEVFAHNELGYSKEAGLTYVQTATDPNAHQQPTTSEATAGKHGSSGAPPSPSTAVATPLLVLAVLSFAL